MEWRIWKNNKFWSAVGALLLALFGGLGTLLYQQLFADHSELKAILSDGMPLPDNSAHMQILHIRNIGKKELAYVSMVINFPQTIQPVDHKCASMATKVENDRGPHQLKIRYKNLPSKSGITCIFLSSLRALKIEEKDVIIAGPDFRMGSDEIKREVYQ